MSLPYTVLPNPIGYDNLGNVFFQTRPAEIEQGPPELFEDFEPGNSDLTINLTPVTP